MLPSEWLPTGSPDEDGTTGALRDQLVKTEPVRSAEPPIISGKCDAKASIACCDALRVAIVSPFAACAATNACAVAAKLAGNAPLIRRRNSAASVRCPARYAANF